MTALLTLHVLERGSTMPTHGHGLYLTTDSYYPADSTAELPELPHNNEQIHDGSQTVHNTTDSYSTSGSQLLNIIKPSTQESSTSFNLDLTSTSHTRDIHDKGDITKTTVESTTARQEGVELNRLITTPQSVVITKLFGLDTNNKSREGHLQTSSVEKIQDHYTDNTKQTLYTTDLSTETVIDITRTVHNIPQTTDNVDHTVTGVNVMKSNNHEESNHSETHTSTKQDGGIGSTRSTRLSRSAENLLRPTAVENTDDTTTQTVQLNKDTMPNNAEPSATYMLDINRLNRSLITATNLKWSTEVAYNSISRAGPPNGLAVGQFALLSNNPVIPHNITDDLRFCQNRTVIQASLGVVNQTLYSYEPLLQQYITRNTRNVLQSYNSLRKLLEKLVNPASQAPTLKFNSLLYVQDRVKSLETFATLNHLARQIEIVLQEIRRCYFNFTGRM